MKIPIVCFEEEDLEALENEIGELRRDKNWIFLTLEEWRKVNRFFEKNAEDMELYESQMDRMVVIRASAMVLRWFQQLKAKPKDEQTIADKASLMNAVLSLHQIDPLTARRLISLLTTE